MDRISVESGTNFRNETFAEARQQLVTVLKAQKSWLTGYAEAYVDEFIETALVHAFRAGWVDGFSTGQTTPNSYHDADDIQADWHTYKSETDPRIRLRATNAPAT